MAVIGPAWCHIITFIHISNTLSNQYQWYSKYVRLPLLTTCKCVVFFYTRYRPMSRWVTRISMYSHWHMITSKYECRDFLELHHHYQYYTCTYRYFGLLPRSICTQCLTATGGVLVGFSLHMVIIYTVHILISDHKVSNGQGKWHSSPEITWIDD